MGGRLPQLRTELVQVPWDIRASAGLGAGDNNHHHPRPLLRAFWSLLDGIWGVLKDGWGVLDHGPLFHRIICLGITS